jgi:hypothetical protein
VGGRPAVRECEITGAIATVISQPRKIIKLHTRASLWRLPICRLCRGHQAAARTAPLGAAPPPAWWGASIAAGRADRRSTALRGTGAATGLVESVYRGRRCDIPPDCLLARCLNGRWASESAREAPDRPPMARRNRMLRNAPPRAINLPRAPLAATPPYRALTARPILCHVQESDPGAVPALPDPFLLAADTDLA